MVRGGGAVSASAALVLLLLVAPSLGSAVMPTTTLSAPYAHSQSSPTRQTQVSGCAKSTIRVPAWNPTSGGLGEYAGSSAKTCGRAVGVTGYGIASTQSGLVVGLPFRVSTAGTHVITTSLTVRLATTNTFTIGGCPKPSFSYPPAPGTGESSVCEAAAYVSWSLSAYVIDANNQSWGAASAYAYAQNDSYYQNFTYCDYYGAIHCYNSSGTFWNTSGSGQFSTNVGGFQFFTWNGPTTLPIVLNESGMRVKDHYLLVVSIGLSTTTIVDSYALASAWAGTAKAIIDMGTLGNGATINSVTIT